MSDENTKVHCLLSRKAKQLLYILYDVAEKEEIEMMAFAQDGEMVQCFAAPHRPVHNQLIPVLFLLLEMLSHKHHEKYYELALTHLFLRYVKKHGRDNTMELLENLSEDETGEEWKQGAVI